jgi:ADP-ribose pyrophosphatase YjhB (NUDIX family)
MVNFSLATKSLIIHQDKALIVKRKSNNPQAPNIWELPGGRLQPGENPFEGLKREIKEETNLEIEIINPLTVRHFTRSDLQVVTLIIFLSKAITTKVTLSDEHENYSWEPFSTIKEKLNPWFHQEIDAFNKLNINT